MNKLKHNKILRLALGGGLVFYVISGLSSILNYLVYPIVSNIVDVQTFGEIQFLFTAFNQLSLGFVVLNILSIIATAGGTTKSIQKDRILSLNIIASVAAGLIATVGVLILIIFKDVLQISETLSIIILGLSLIINVPFTIMIGQLQGNNKFLQSGLISLLATFLKLILSVLFVLAGAGSTGAMLGIFIGMLASIIIGATINPDLKIQVKKVNLSIIKFLKKPALHSLIIIGTLTLMSSVDLIAARTIMTSAEAGAYSGVATISKIILAALSPILWLSIPLAVSGNKKVIHKYLLISTLLSIIFVLFILLGINFIMTNIMSIDDSSYNSLAGLLSISMSIYGLANILAGVSIGSTSTSRSTIITYLITLTMFIFAIIFITNPNILEILYLQLIAGIALTIPLLTSLYLPYKSKK